MTDFFDRKLSLLLLFFTLPLLFLPKLNVFSIGEETAGIRYDDLILFFFAGLFLLAQWLSKRKLDKIEKLILTLTLFSIFSYSLNRLLVSLHLFQADAKLFYTLRVLEYFLFFYIGFMAARFMDVSKVILCFFLWNFVIILLQKIGLIGAFTVVGYNPSVSERVYGIASFPSEMGLILNLLYCYFIFDNSPFKILSQVRSPLLKNSLEKSYVYWVTIPFALLIIFTGNRISLVALFFTFLLRLKQDLKLSSLFAMLLLFPLLIGGGIMAIKGSAGIYERSLHLFSPENIELSSLVWKRVDLSASANQQNEEKKGDFNIFFGKELPKKENFDPSWKIRIHKWIYMIKSYITTPVSYLQGLGPGFAGSALDGGLLRIVTENGIIGAILYWLFFRRLYQINDQLKWMTIAFLINMIFFDAYLAYKSMSLLLFAAGAAFYTQKREKEKLGKLPEIS